MAGNPDRNLRVLVTGSRDWDNFTVIHSELMRVLHEAGGYETTDITLVHGACPTGADQMADDVWTVAGLKVERHPAEWRSHGVYNAAAGMQRNTKMVELGANLCLAFIKNKSRGATDCAWKAEAAGIPVRRFHA